MDVMGRRALETGKDSLLLSKHRRLDRRGLGEDEDALSHIIEFTLALIIFLIVIAGYFKAVDTEFVIHTPEDSRRDELCIRYSETLIRDTGMAKTTAGNTTHWETLTPEELEQNLTRPGLASEGGEFGIISEEKILGLRNLTYPRMREILSIGKHNFNLEVTELNGSRITFFGFSSDGVKKGSRVERVLVMKNGTGERAVKLTFRLFKGINIRTLVRVSELMYHPEGSRHEWIELYNPSDEAVNLSTLTLYTQKGTIARDHLHGDSMILPGKGHGVVADNEAVWSEYNVSSDALKLYVNDQYIGQGGLSNTGMDITIAGEDFRTQSYSYNNTFGGDGNGYSLEWSYEENAWRESRVKGGTPGRANSVD